MEPTNLIESQLKALDFMNNSTDLAILIKGSAGVGKTTAVREFCNRFRRVLLTATTHKAVEVLRQFSDKPCKTMHSFLKLKRELINGKYEFVFDLNNDFDDIDVLIVDESSMVNTKELSWLLQCARANRFRIIFVGDDKQLNPIGEINSPVFHQGFPEYELTEILRHQNDIIDLSRNLDWLYERRNGEHFEWFEGNDIPLDKLIEANGTNKAKFITWSNPTVKAVNNQVRRFIYDDPNQFELGETILMKAPFKDLYKNNEEIKVEKLSHTSFYFNDADIPYPSIDTFSINGDLEVLNAHDQNKHKQNIQDLLDKAKFKIVSWKTYYKYLESFGEYQYNHAVTVHKSQGSSYDYSFVNISEIIRNPNTVERSRMLYTAITRAKEKNLLL